MIRIGMKNLSVKISKMVFEASKDESILEREKGQGYISIDGEMETPPWVVLLETIKMWEELRSSETGLLSLQSTMQIGGHATSAIGR